MWTQWVWLWHPDEISRDNSPLAATETAVRNTAGLAPSDTAPALEGGTCPLSNPLDPHKPQALWSQPPAQARKPPPGVCSSLSSARRSPRGRPPPPTQRSAKTASRQRQRFEIQRAAFTAAQHNRVLIIQTIQLVDARPTVDSLVRQTLLVFDRLLDVLGFLDLVRADLHHAAAAVCQQQIILAALLVNDHVDRPIPIPKLCDRLALDPGARLDLRERELHQGRAGVSGQQMRLIPDLERHKGPNWGARLESSM